MTKFTEARSAGFEPTPLVLETNILPTELRPHIDLLSLFRKQHRTIHKSKKSDINVQFILYPTQLAKDLAVQRVQEFRQERNQRVELCLFLLQRNSFPKPFLIFNYILIILQDFLKVKENSKLITKLPNPTRFRIMLDNDTKF